MLSVATGLVILPSMDVDVRAEPAASDSTEESTTGEPRKLIERPQTRDAISTSKPARGLFPSLFSSRKTEPALQLPPKEPGDTRSEVQRHLDELYRREGRDAPSMDIGQTPAAGLNPSAGIKPEINSTASPTAGPIRQVSSNPFKRFFQKITPFRRSKRANDERPDHVEPMSAAARQEQLRLQQTPIARPIAVPDKAAPEKNDEPMPIPLSTKKIVARPAMPQLDLLVPPAPDSPDDAAEDVKNSQGSKLADSAASPELKEKSSATARKLPEFLPAVELPEGSAPQILAAELSDEPIGSETVEPASDELLGNPFPELSEAEADGAPVIEPARVAESEAQDKANPFTGLKLEAEKEAGAVQQTAADEIELPKLPDLPAPAELAAPDDATLAEKLPEITPADKPEEKSGSDKSRDEKLRKIAERSELTGLKGFCPVALRDERELKDARPQFQAEFDGKVFNLSSAEAKAKFEASPESYAPAASGKDVVLAANEGAEREGSLDQAVWYRNRLYLFSSKDSHEEFVASPAKFAVGETAEEESE